MNDEPSSGRATSRGALTRQRLKRSAQRLFALRGIGSVGLREVALAIGQRNSAAAHYHFGAKDDLLRELLTDGARALDLDRQAILDAAEGAGAVTMADVVAALVVPNLRLSTDPGQPETWFRFLANLIAERRQFFEDSVVDRHAEGYRRCIAHVRELLPEVAAQEVNRRLVFATLTLQALFAAREAALDGMDATAPHAFWDRDDVTAGIGDTIEAILLQHRGRAA